MSTMISKISTAFDELKADASKRLQVNRKVIATMSFTEVAPDSNVIHTIDHEDEIPYLQKHKTLYGRKYTRVFSTVNMNRLATVVMFLLFGTMLNAQVPICGTVSGTSSHPCYSTQYKQVTSDMIKLPYEVSAFPNWEVWTKNGYVYVIRKAKQRFSFLSYAKFNCIVLQLPKSIPQEELVTR